MSNREPILVVDVTEMDGGTFTLREVCERGECHAELVIELVEYGIISPLDEHTDASRWQFDAAALRRLRKALRLQRDLKINLPGLAMSLDLLDELEDMRREVRRLSQQLQQLLDG